MKSQEERNSELTHLIKEFYVEDLFCTYTYKLGATQVDSTEPEKIMLLYGNNGAGKTTILNIIYHLLNPEPYGGHRSFVGAIPFKKLEVLLSSGYKICAERKDPDAGVYTVFFHDNNQNQPLEWTWFPDKTGRIEAGDDSEYMELCSRLKKLNIIFHYLRDTRRVEGLDDKRRSRARYALRDPDYVTAEYFASDDENDEEIFSPTKILKRSIGRAIDWFRQQALFGTNIGSASVNSIYKDLIKNVVTQGKSSDDDEEISIGDLKNKLFSLNERNKDFARFGLTPDLDINDIVGYLDSAELIHTDLLRTVLSPYLDGHNARLDALQEVQKVMFNFISLLGDFYSEKNVNMHLREGLQIISKRGVKLPPTVLSSGEKQLLLLLCHAISARKRGTIFVIDEPEISLNVKWQRQLIPALLTCLAGTESQIILATHSIELLSQYKDYVTPLENLNQEV